MRWLTSLVLVTLAAVPSAHAQNPASPNVIVFMTDDMGYADIGSYGASDIRTPNIDSLARDGVRLTDFYSNGVLCSPTRAGFISGRYQQRYGIENALPNAGMPGDRGLKASRFSLPQLLRTNGYATALIGKWHLGYTADTSPGAHGFAYFFGLKSGFHDYYQHTSGNGRPDLWENDTPIHQDGYMTDLITARAVRFVEQNAGRPFFIDVAFNAPHWPYQVPDKPSVAPGNGRHVMPSEPGASTRADYAAMLERVDRGVGEILRALEQRGLVNNTIVIFTNDNGGEWLASNAPLFNRKLSVWEGGIRVPAIVRWPGRTPRGMVSSQVGITMDLTASILAATNTAAPAEARFEGINLFPILEGRVPEMPRTLFWRTNVGNRNQKAVRSGDWKLVIDGSHTMIFNIRSDVGERNELANRRQDIARKLRPLLAEWEQDVEAEAKAGQAATTTSR